MGKFIDLTGQRFGRLEVIGKVEKPSNRKYTAAYWLCKCDCGNKKVVASIDLRRGVTKSCGCLLSQMAIIKCGNEVRDANEKLTYRGTKVNYLSSKTRKDNTSGQKVYFGIKH